MENVIVKQHNAISKARYHMSALEKNVVYMLMKQINNEVKSFYEVRLSDLERISGKNVDHKNFRKSANLLTDRVLGIDLKKEGYVDITIFLSAEYINSQGCIRLELSKEVHRLFSNLKNNFTTFQLKVALELRSKHSKRIYEMLSQYKDTGKMYIEISKLKERLGVLNQYKEFGMFKKKVLEVAKKQIKELAEFEFDYEVVKTGKKYTHLHFKIKPNLPKVEMKKSGNNNLSSEKIIKRLCNNYKLSFWQAKIIVQKVTIKEICKELYEIDLERYNGKIRNIGGYTAKRFDQKYQLGLFAGKNKV